MHNSWTTNNYQDFLNYLNSIKEEKYKEFHEGLVLNSKGELIGITTAMISNQSSEIGIVTPINDLKDSISTLCVLPHPQNRSDILSVTR